MNRGSIPATLSARLAKLPLTGPRNIRKLLYDVKWAFHLDLDLYRRMNAVKLHAPN